MAPNKALTVTTRQRAALRARAHGLEPVVQIGEKGITDGIAAEVDRSLAAHELIKVKLPGADREERAALAATLAERTESAVVQEVGRILVLWRPRPEED